MKTILKHLISTLNTVGFKALMMSSAIAVIGLGMHSILILLTGLLMMFLSVLIMALSDE